MATPNFQNRTLYHGDNLDFLRGMKLRDRSPDSHRPTLLESFRSLLKRGYVGVYHWFSIKHLHRYVTDFEGRHNDRRLNTIDQMASLVRGMKGRRRRYIDLIGDPDTRLNGQFALV